MTKYFINDPKYRWDVVAQTKNETSFKGDEGVAKKVSVLAETVSFETLCESLETFFKLQKCFTSGVVETEDCIIAWVDHIRSWPLFYSLKGDQFLLSNDARAIQSLAGLTAIDQTAKLEFSMSGYVTGKQTLYQNLFCLQPGEFLVFNKADKAFRLHKYYTYFPKPSGSHSEMNKREELGRILDEMTREIIAKASGSKIWVPLSAGLDSRILLCKLHEHGYQNIETFTYGPRYNFEAVYAKKIARTLNVPWRRLSFSRSHLKKVFESDTRKDFWNFADNLKNIPCMREYSAIAYLHDQNIAKPGDIFINGQSGDFITGGHVPKVCFSQETVDADTFFDAINSKHYSLWNSLKTSGNLRSVREKIDEILGPDWESIDGSLVRAGQAECWEYEARQICYVVNGQRVYEFFGFEWEMPLWDKRLVDFCMPLSLSDKEGQSLFKSYLQDYNYHGLFPQKEPHLWRWPVPMLWVVGVAQFIKVFLGDEKKANFYKFMRYYGHYANQYAFFPLELHKKHYQDARNEVSLYVSLWLEDNMKHFIS